MSSLNWFDSVPQSTLVRVIIILVGIIYGTLYHSGWVPEALNAGLTVTLLLLLVEIFIEMRNKFESTDLTADIKGYLERDRDIFGNLLETFHHQILQSFKLTEGGYMISHPALAVLSYHEFWKLLVQEQQRRGESNPLTVQAIHSSKMDIWYNHPLQARLIDLQKEFREHGAKITRVLCGDTPKPVDSVRQAYTKMHNAKIDVIYYDTTQGVVDHHFGWDFLYIRETGKSVIWRTPLSSGGGVPGEAIYLNSLSYERQKLDDLFDNISRHSIPFSEPAKTPNE